MAKRMVFTGTIESVSNALKILAEKEAAQEQQSVELHEIFTNIFSTIFGL